MYKGEQPDKRKQKLKDKDYDSRELGVSDFKYVTYKQALKNAKAYVERNQFSKSSCLPSACCSALWNTENEDLAEEFLYSQRINKDQEGSIWHDIAQKIIDQGICRRILMPQVKTEKEANKIKITDEQREDAKKYKQKAFIWIKQNDFEWFASTLNNNIAIPFSIWADLKEWGKFVPEILYPKLTRDKSNVHHAICAIPNTAYKTKEGVGFFITDSAHFGGYAKREIKLDFWSKRLNAGLYFEDLEYIKPTKWVTPKIYKGYKFDKDLVVGSEGEDVNALQEIMKANGFFPNRKTTYYFGGITRQAVKDFQEEYKTDILIKLGLTKGTGHFKSSTRNFLNSLLK